MTYKPSRTERTVQVIPPNQIVLNNGKISGDTTQKLSYQPIANIKPASPIIPSQGTTVSSEPMENVTTQKHDYVKQPFSKRDLTKSLENNVKLATHSKFDDKSTNRLTYVPHDQSTTKKIIPKNGLTRNIAKMDYKTIYKISYLPVVSSEGLVYPTLKQSDTCGNPNASIDFTTTSGSSYAYPGKFVECRNARNCVDCPAELISQRVL